MSKALLVSTFRSIKFSLSRFISIVLIVMLGVSFFAGVKATSPDMKATAINYFIENNLMDLRVQSTLGLTNTDLRAISKIDGVDYVMAAKYVDALVYVNDEVEADIDGSQISARAYSINMQMFADYTRGKDDGNFINRPTLIEGNYPTKEDECLVDASALSTPDSYQIGSKIRLENGEDSVFSSIKTNEFTIVGIIETPYYLSFERGNTLVGSGKVGTFIYIPEDVFVTDYYTEVYITVEGADEFDPFSDEYYEHLQPVVETLEALAPECLSSRANQINISLPSQITDARIELAQKQVEVEDSLAAARSDLDELKNFAENGEEMLREAKEEFERKFAEVDTSILTNETQVSNYTAQYQTLLLQLNNMAIEINTKQRAYDESKAKFDPVNQQVKDLRAGIASKEADIETLTGLIDDTMEVLAQVDEQQQLQMSDPTLQGILSSVDILYPDFSTMLKSFSAQGIAFTMVEMMRPMVEQYRTDLAQQKNDLEQLKEDLDKVEPVMQELEAAYDAAYKLLQDAKVAYDNSERSLSSMYTQIMQANSGVSEAKTKAALEKVSKSYELAEYQRKLETAEEDYEKALAEYAEAEYEANKELLLAQTKIGNAEKLLDKVSSAEWYVYDRTNTPGYTSLSDTIDNMATIANIFPLFFFLLAAMISLTTITRMVEEDRTQFGTLMALGYAPGSIVAKYVLYALFASVIGSAIGLVLGFYIIPHIIMAAYGIMFTLPDVIITFPWQYIVIGVLVSLCSTVVAAVLACRKDIKVNPAVLMRPKSPRPGKRVFLEKIGFIWLRLGFTSKVTIRNLFRNPKRFIMTLTGMAGCTALLLASFGFYNSVEAIMSKQFGDGGISEYDVQFVFASPQNPDEKSDVMDTIMSDSRMESVMMVSMQSYDGGSDRVDKMYDVYVFVPSDNGELSRYIKLQNRKTKQSLELTDGAALVTEKFARDTDTSVGDTVYVKDSDGKTVYLTVGGIVENYTFSYIYVSRSMYQSAFGAEPKFGYAIGRLTDKARNATVAKDGTSTDKSQMATDLMKHYQINAVAYTTDSMDMFSEIVRTISVIVIMFICAAVLLAFVVLYNLSNININERTRELATLKVVGFFDGEVSAYIQRENLILTFISTLAGLVLGVGLHRLLVTFTEIDAVMFGRSINWQSFVIAALMSVLFSLLISIIMRKKIINVDMVESFKSAE